MRDPGLVQRRQTWSGRGGNRTRSFLRAPAFAFFQSRRGVALRGARRSSRRAVFIHRVGRLRAFQSRASRARSPRSRRRPGARARSGRHVRDVKVRGRRRRGFSARRTTPRRAFARRVPPPRPHPRKSAPPFAGSAPGGPVADLLAPEDGILRESVVVGSERPPNRVRIVAVSENARALHRGGDETACPRGGHSSSVCRFRVRVTERLARRSRRRGRGQPRARSGSRERARDRRESVVDGSRHSRNARRNARSLDVGTDWARLTCRAARVRVARSVVPRARVRSGCFQTRGA